jgi:hypothetical protein
VGVGQVIRVSAYQVQNPEFKLQYCQRQKKRQWGRGGRKGERKEGRKGGRKKENGVERGEAS